MSTWCGGGAGVKMLGELGGHPDALKWPFWNNDSEYNEHKAGPNPWPDYMAGGQNVADDFAGLLPVVNDPFFNDSGKGRAAL